MIISKIPVDIQHLLQGFDLPFIARGVFYSFRIIPEISSRIPPDIQAGMYYGDSPRVYLEIFSFFPGILRDSFQKFAMDFLQNSYRGSTGFIQSFLSNYLIIPAGIYSWFLFPGFLRRFVP